MVCTALPFQAHGTNPASAAVANMRIVVLDLKPANLLVDAEAGGRLVISDFGISRTVETASQAFSRTTNASGGTPGCMAPEQLQYAQKSRPGRPPWAPTSAACPDACADCGPSASWWAGWP